MTNLTENTKEIINTKGIKNKDTIDYINNETKHKIKISDNKIFLLRENKDFIHNIIFELNKTTKTEYYIKEYNTSIDLKIKTTKIKITNKQIEIYYTIIDNSTKYCYIIEMSEII